MRKFIDKGQVKVLEFFFIIWLGRYPTIPESKKQKKAFIIYLFCIINIILLIWKG